MALAVALAQEEIEFIKKNLGNWLAEQSLGKPRWLRDRTPS